MVRARLGLESGDQSSVISSTGYKRSCAFSTKIAIYANSPVAKSARHRSIQGLTRSSPKLTRQRAPSFQGLRSSSPAASLAKQRNVARNTVPELLLRSALWRRGIRYRLHANHLPGKPDIIFPRQQLAIFCDGDFWHGRDWAVRRGKLARGSNAPYWVAKIDANIARDRRSRARLRRLGWRIVRLWETDIKRDPELAALAVMRALS